MRAYLNGFLKYHETVDEVYDHVLTAIEDKPENLSFQEAVNQVLNDDFGGGNGLLKMEKQHLKDATWEGFSQIKKYIKADFKFPNILYTLLLFSAIDYLISHIQISFSQYYLTFPGAAVVFCVFISTRRFFAGYYKSDTRLSVHDVAFVRFNYPSYWSVMILNLLLSFLQRSNKFPTSGHPEFFAIILTLYVLYISSLVKICRDEFKPYFAR